MESPSAPKLLIAHSLVKAGRLEPIRVDPRSVTTPCNPLGLEGVNEASSPPLASHFVINPEGAEIEPPVMSVSVNAPEDRSIPA